VTSTRLRLVRWLVPFAVIGMVLGVAGLRTTLASATPSLPELTAAQLLAKVAQSDVQSLSGTVRTSANLGLPALPDAEGALGPQAVLSGEQTLRLYLDGPQRQRVDLFGSLAETKLVRNGRQVWHWSSSTNKATHICLPARPSQRPGHQPDRGTSGRDRMLAGSPQALAWRLLAAIGPTTQVSVGRAATVAGRPAYDLRLAPKTADSLIRRANLYVDAATGLPLRATVLARGASKPAVDVGFTSITLGAPPASVFAFRAPAGAKVSKRSVPSWTGKPHPDAARPRVHGSGWVTAVEIRGGSAAAVTDPRIGVLLRSARTVTGQFGSGKLLTSRLLTVLVTGDGRIFAGPVTAPALLRMASAAGPR